MSQDDSLQPHLERIQVYLNEEKTKEALEELNRLLETHQESVEVHQLRLTVLLPDLNQPHLIQDTLLILFGHDDAAYEDARARIEEPLYEKLETLKKSINRCRTRADVLSYLRHLDELSALGSFFPIIYFAQGVAYLEARKLKPVQMPHKDPSSLYETLLGSLKPSSPSPNQDVVLPVRDKQYTEWTSAALAALRSALELFEDSAWSEDDFAAEIYELLGTVYEEDDDLLAALELYSNALERGRPIETLFDRFVVHLMKQVQGRILVRVDLLLSQNDLERAVQMLDEYAPQPLTDEWRLRLAEISLLKGDIDQAATHYTHLLLKDEAGNNPESKEDEA